MVSGWKMCNSSVVVRDVALSSWSKTLHCVLLEVCRKLRMLQVAKIHEGCKNEQIFCQFRLSKHFSLWFHFLEVPGQQVLKLVPLLVYGGSLSIFCIWMVKILHGAGGERERGRGGDERRREHVTFDFHCHQCLFPSLGRTSPSCVQQVVHANELPLNVADLGEGVHNPPTNYNSQMLLFLVIFL